MDPLASLRQLVQTYPLIDNHAHNLLNKSNACNYEKYAFEQITSEAQGIALENAPHTLPLQRAAHQLATLYDSPSNDWDRVKEARDQWVKRDYDELIRRCLEGTHSLLLDDLLTDEDIEPFDWHDRFTTAPTKRIVRIEVVAAQVLAAILPEGYSEALDDVTNLRQTFDRFREGFHQEIEKAVADAVVVGFKSVICYRTGLHVQCADDKDDDSRLLQSFARTIQQRTGPTYRVEDKPLNDWVVRQTLDLLQAARTSTPLGPNKPLQLHTGLGDNDINLILSNPAYLQDLIARYPKVDFVLLHSSYPYTREAGYLACVYPNVYLDLGEVFPMVSRDAQESIIRESLEVVPTNRLLWSTDGHFYPETFWLANKQFRDALEKVLVDYVRQGDFAIEQAKTAASDILFHNSNRLYSLNETNSYDETQKPCSRPLAGSSSDEWKAFVQNNPDIKYIWLQFFDYTATLRLRIFPVQEFAKIVRKERRIGVCLATQQMLQNDTVCPEGSTTGQFYMQPDLSTLSRNVGLDSKSATVMSWWLTEDGRPLPGCPRTLLRNVTNQLQSEHGIQVLCGFEIEVVFLRCITNPDTDQEDFVPCVKNHSWSQMTRETRRMVPLLEEIAETLASIGINLEQFHSESAPGQFEFVLPPGPPLAAVDTLLKARQVVTQVAEQHGLRATLHPRPYTHAAGTASHAHLSITPSTKEDSFLAGILQHYPALMAVALAGDVSYDRVCSGLWAGSEWVSWGTQNRESPIRKISPAHWEIKTLDGLANMYIAMSAFLAAGYLGVKNNEPLTASDCPYDSATLSEEERKSYGITTQLPKSLSQSLDELEADSALQEVLGSTLVANYILVKRAEKKKLDSMEEEARRKWLLERY
ncbi:extracellular developmental signal biosynthesis protein FluG [Aspergillus saccharolyticus JOP 1030-1]|uniref:Glutamine synthetase/guanido kinase n=1 Tax=Aspergillus saccharolyticus JOP 1030-1 TaxID=1450539 RepID=A0A318ZSP9_9EURO|nr:glutamine synthetase/guanido kinase [Aspergillus saccharolyticus JOP 1030-1]PYH49674.1 glutamine synthetase/guanido kinase [Aspergillus saccharolyticus JOP 1030-1]